MWEGNSESGIDWRLRYKGSEVAALRWPKFSLRIVARYNGVPIEGKWRFKRERTWIFRRTDLETDLCSLRGLNPSNLAMNDGSKYTVVRNGYTAALVDETPRMHVSATFDPFLTSRAVFKGEKLCQSDPDRSAGSARFPGMIRCKFSRSTNYFMQLLQILGKGSCMNSIENSPNSETTTAFRLQRKAVKELFSNRPDGLERDELSRLAQAKGINGDEFQKVLKSLLASGHLYYDEANGKYRFVRNE
jgi:hypothetical protein